MAIPAWFWPATGSARAVALVPYAAGMAVADWSTPTLWPFSAGAFSAPIALASGTPGFAAAVAGASGDVWALTYAGSLYHVTSGGASGLAATLPSGQVYVGLAAGPSGYPYGVASNGNFYAYSGSPASGAFGAPAWFAAASTSLLYTLCPSLSGVGTTPFSGGASGLLALPAALATPTVLTYGSALAVGGWQPAPALAAAAAAAVCPPSGTYVVGVGSGTATLWQAPGIYADAWAQIQQLTGLGSLAAVAWRPDGAQALAAAATGVQVMAFSGGVLSSAQTIGIAGACGVAIAGDSAHALIAQSGLSQATPLVYGAGSWATGVAVTGLPGIVAIAPVGASGAYAAVSGGLSILELLGGTWSVAASAATAFVPTCLCTDNFGNAYLAGSGSIAQFTSAGALLASGTWSGGAPTAVAVQQGRVLLAVPGDGLFRIFGLSAPGALTQQGSHALAAGAQVGLGLSATTLFVMGSGGTNTYGFSGAPFTLTSVMSGAVAVYSGGWTATPLGIGHVPSALTYDASGSLQIATIQNTWWTLTSEGGLTSGIVPVYSGQTQSVPLGTSALLASGSHLYAATSLSGVLIQLA